MPLSCRDSDETTNSGQYAGNETAAPAEPTARIRPELAPIRNLIAQNNNTSARLHLQSHLAQDPDDAEALFLFALSFHRELRYGQARPHFERAIELRPHFHPAYHFYGWCLYYLGELDAAREAFEQHLDMAPPEGDSHFALGVIALDEGNLSEAELRFTTALDLLDEDPQRPADRSRAHARLGEVYERQGKLEEAREQLVKATTLFPDHYEAEFMLYRVLTRLGEDEAAQAALKRHEETKQRLRPEPPPVEPE